MLNRYLPCPALLLALCLAAPGHAQTHDCSEEAAYRAFDFWLGDWAVHDAKGQLAGHNRISAIENGCALREQWTSSRGTTGQSLNFYDPQQETWRQLWVDQGGHLIDISGGLTTEGMLLRGEIRYPGNPEAQAFRGLWTPLPDGRVRQFFEQRDAEGEWQTWFEGFYSRQHDAPGDAASDD